MLRLPRRLSIVIETLPETFQGERRGLLPVEVRRRFEAIVFDWDGTAVPDRDADASEVRHLIESLCAAGMEIAVVSGTHVGNVDGQLGARPSGPGHLYLCMNRGSEVFEADADGVRLMERREATRREEAALDAAAELTVKRLGERGLRAKIVSQRLNRRKIDLIPEPRWADPPKARIAELLQAVEARLRGSGLQGLLDVVRLAERCATEAGLADPRVTSDAKHVEIGLTDKSDAGRWVFRQMGRRGIAPCLVLLAGDEFGPLGGLPGSDSLMLVPEGHGATAVSVGAEPGGVPEGVFGVGGGPKAFVRMLEDQLDRRTRGEVPVVQVQAGWTLTVEGFDPERERVHESLLTLADGRIGTRGSPLVAVPGAAPEVLASGVYDGAQPETRLLPCPVWTRLHAHLKEGSRLRRTLDLGSGLLREELMIPEGALDSLRFASLARPGIAVLRAEGPPDVLRPGSALVSAKGEPAADSGRADGARWVRAGGPEGGVVAAARDRVGDDDGCRRLDRLAVYHSDPGGEPHREAALRTLGRATEAGFDRLLVEHREAWARRWEHADVAIERDHDLQLAVRLALFHLMGSVADSDEAAVGARGLSGPAYQGHVFWDSDVFVLPFLAATHPPAARAMLEYRIRRLPAALSAAKAMGRSGARFPWESARSGNDVTPTSARDRTGRVVPIRTGQLEEHIVADVAWAAGCYAEWTGDDAFLAGPGRSLLVETARYWASRVRFDVQGAAHIYGVIGPDEYHEAVDDNAFTNVMARWNLRRAAGVAKGPGAPDALERLQWLETADALVDGYDRRTGLYEQFAGFWGLEPLIIEEVAPKRPIVADLLLGRDRVRGAQVVKQADVLMLHHMVPDEVVPGSLQRNLEFYEPRTAHGSSLSPGIHAALFARAGRLEEATRALDLASRIDLDDLTGSTASGLHLAAMGSVWQALVYGFAGIRPHGDVLDVDPRIPSAWGSLDVRLQFRGAALAVHMEPASIRVTSDRRVRVRLGGRGRPLNVTVGESRFRRVGERWERVRG